MNSVFSVVAFGMGTLAFFSSMGTLSANHRGVFSDHPSLPSPIKENSFNYSSQKTIPFSTSPPQVSILDLLENTSDYHQRRVLIRGLITQPELHLDETELYLDFVFRLEQETQSIIVYGRHDRTLGPPAIRMNQSVEIIGTFFKEQKRNGATIINVLEAISINPYPSSIPKST